MLTNWNPARMPEKDEMKLRLSTARKQLYDLQMKIKEHKIPVIVLFEGWGTSGKGSTIGKVIRNIDPRFFKVVTMSEPTDEELRYPFLYRFFKEIPEAGKFTFLDSGWLEQICREHLEGKTDEKEYASRIESVRNFERQLTDNGYLVLKFFMQIEKKEQKEREQDLLESCYRTSLNLAKENGCQSVAFPLISSGIYGYPKDQALKVAVDTISAFLLENEMMVYIVIFDKKAYQISGKLFADIAAYIDDWYVDEHTDSRVEQRRRLEALSEESCFEAASAPLPSEAICKSCSSQSLEEALGQIDESFSEMLLRKIDESGMTDAQCYKKANIDRKLFSKIRSDKFYKPSKPTVLAFALALELPLAQMQEMLGKAGFTLSHSSKFDIIVEYFVERGNYNVYEINEALFAFDQSLIGA